MKEPDVVFLNQQLFLNPTPPVVVRTFINSIVNPRRRSLLSSQNSSAGITKMPRRKKEFCENTTKRIIIRSAGAIKEKPQQRNAANARERARMRVLSRAFCRLKTSLPWVPPDTKLSKLDTLRLTTSYIAHLKGILQDDPYKPAEPMHPSMSMTWPFGFNRLGVSSGSGVGGSEEEDEEDDEGSNCSSWEEMRSRLTTRRTDCVHLDTDFHPVEPNNATNPVFHPHHPINTLNAHISASYPENILSFS